MSYENSVNLNSKRYNRFDKSIENVYHNNNCEISATQIARVIAKEYPKAKIVVDSFRKYVSTYLNKKGYHGLEIEDFKRLKTECDAAGINVNEVKHAWIKDDGVSFFLKNPQFQEEERELFFNALIDDLKGYEPKFPKLIRSKFKDSYLLVIDPCDLHIGKLAEAIETGEDYNNQIAVQRALKGVRGILHKTQGFPIDKILFVGGNDILHIDTPKRMTTSGTPQDTCGMWYSNFMIAKKLYVEILEILIGVADVHFVYNPSNHDYTNGFFLADVVKTYFRNCDNITFDCSISHRKYFRYGKNLIGTCHGDSAKKQDLGSLMSIEAKQDWAKVDHRYFYTHHVHHKESKDYINITVETMRSASGTDSWHHRKGFTGAPKAVEGFLHCKEHGQICRITHIF